MILTKSPREQNSKIIIIDESEFYGGKERMEEVLLLGALNELAEALGDSNSSPLSSSLLCLRCGITFDQKGKIVVSFNQVLRSVPFARTLD